MDHPDPIVFLTLAVDTAGRLYDDFIRLIFFSNSSAGNCSGEWNFREYFLFRFTIVFLCESDQFRFLRDASLVNLKGSVVLILTKASFT